jgi:hypothetical protein
VAWGGGPTPCLIQTVRSWHSLFIFLTLNHFKRNLLYRTFQFVRFSSRFHWHSVFCLQQVGKTSFRHELMSWYLGGTERGKGAAILIARIGVGWGGGDVFTPLNKKDDRNFTMLICCYALCRTSGANGSGRWNEIASTASCNAASTVLVKVNLQEIIPTVKCWK